MSKSSEQLSAPIVHERLVGALAELHKAERNVVVWFSEILRRQLYRRLGYSSMHHYATDALGFSKGRTSQLIRVCELLKTMPRLREAVASGEVSWTKAREVVAVVTPASEGEWVDRARSSSRRELERSIAEARAKAESVRTGVTSQVELGSLGGRPRRDSKEGAAHTSVGPDDDPSTVSSAPITVSLRMDADAFARFEALCEAVRKSGHRGSIEDLVLAGLDTLASETGPQRDNGANRGARREPTPPIVTSPYQVVVYRCEECGRGHVPTSRGDRELDAPTLQRIVCDSQIAPPGKPRRSSVSPGKRRRVLARDGHRCRMKGCNSRSFLEVHHIVPTRHGGSDDPENLATLCHACHDWVHRRSLSRPEEIERLLGAPGHGGV